MLLLHFCCCLYHFAQHQTPKITFYMYLRKFELLFKRESDTKILQRPILVSFCIPQRNMSYTFRHKNVLFACKRQGYVITYLKWLSNCFILEQNAIKGELEEKKLYLRSNYCYIMKYMH